MLERIERKTTREPGDIVLDEEQRQVTSANGTHSLTPMEFRLLQFFMLHRDHLVPRESLMKTIWKTDYLGDTRTLDVHISWLRKKIEANPRRPRYLRTVRGYGYIFKLDQ